MVVTGGPRLGDAETGTVAELTTAPISVISGGLACLVGVGLLVLAVPALWNYRADAEPAPATA